LPRRARVEHVFGALAQMGGKLVRCMGIVRVTFALSLKGGELQPETAGVPEGRWAGTVLNDYGAPNRLQIAVRSLPRRFPQQPWPGRGHRRNSPQTACTLLHIVKAELLEVALNAWKPMFHASSAIIQRSAAQDCVTGPKDWHSS